MSPLTKAEALGMAPDAWEPRSVGSHLNLVHHAAAQLVKCHLGFRGWHEPLCWGRQQWVRDPFMTCGTSLILSAALWGPHSLRGRCILSQDTAAGLAPHPVTPPHPSHLTPTCRLQLRSARHIASGPPGRCSAATPSTPRTPSSRCSSSLTRGAESRPSRLCNAPVSGGAAEGKVLPVATPLAQTTPIATPPPRWPPLLQWLPAPPTALDPPSTLTPQA